MSASTDRRTGSSSNRPMNQSIMKRLQSELMTVMRSKGAGGISAFPNGANIMTWTASITGVEGTVYEGLTYKMSIEFTENYPFEPPCVRFTTPCFHPNVDVYGNICLDILKEKWSAVYNVQTLLLSLQTLLGDPNNASPLNGLAAQLWADPVTYKKHVLAMHKKAAA